MGHDRRLGSSQCNRPNLFCFLMFPAKEIEGPQAKANKQEIQNKDSEIRTKIQTNKQSRKQKNENRHNKKKTEGLRVSLEKYEVLAAEPTPTHRGSHCWAVELMEKSPWWRCVGGLKRHRGFKRFFLFFFGGGVL